MLTYPLISVEPVSFTDPAHRNQWYLIRSEDSVRYGCRSVKKITVEQHRTWWEASSRSNERMLFFIKELADLPEHSTFESPYYRIVGILRVDHRLTWMEVWLAVKPEDRHRKIATRALALLSEKAAKLKWPPLGAVVSGKKNLASWKLFTHAGFVTTKSGFVQLIQKGRGL